MVVPSLAFAVVNNRPSTTTFVFGFIHDTSLSVSAETNVVYLFNRDILKVGSEYICAVECDV